MKTILSWYAKNTFVRHFLVAAGAVAVMLWASPVTDWIQGFVKSNDAAMALVTGLSAWIIRWAQTRLELLIAKINSPAVQPPVPPVQ